MWTSYGTGQYVASEAHQILAHRLYSPDASRRLINYCHGKDGNATAWRTFAPEMFTIAESWRIASLSCDLGGTSTWGNDTSGTRVGQARTYGQTQLGTATDKLVLYGQSMGALTALRYAKDNPGEVAAIALYIPVLDLDDIHDNNRGGYAASIETAYGGLAAYDAAEPTHNPINYAEDFQGIPIKVWAGTTDTICIYSLTQEFAERADAELVTLTGIGHEIGAIPAADLAAFLMEHLQP